jgi:hypothetical protein
VVTVSEDPVVSIFTVATLVIIYAPVRCHNSQDDDLKTVHKRPGRYFQASIMKNETNSLLLSCNVSARTYFLVSVKRLTCSIIFNALFMKFIKRL